jgi:hypothetical protein
MSTGDLQDLLAQGRLSQRCPACGITEAAGSYCTACYTPTSEADWRPSERSAAQLAALDRLRASGTAKSAPGPAEEATPTT